MSKSHSSKRFVAQVLLVTSNGDEIRFMCVPGTHTEKIRRIKQGRRIIQESVRFVEVGPQKLFKYEDISPI